MLGNKFVYILVLASITGSVFSGCGKSKETKAQPPVTQQTTPPLGTEGRPNGRTPTTGDGTKAPQPVAPPTDDRTPTRPPNRPPAGQPPVKQPPVVGQPPVPVVPQEPIDINERVKFDDAEAIKTGGVKVTGEKSDQKQTEFFYTGSAKDILLQVLISLNSYKSDAERSIDAQIARDLTSAKLSTLKNSGKNILTLGINEEGTKSYNLQLVSSDENPNYLLPKQENFPKQIGILEAVSAELTCMDANPSKVQNGQALCSVMVARVQLANGKAQIIFRKNKALVDATFIVNQQDLNFNYNYGYELWKNYIGNRVDQIIDTPMMDSAIISSYEIVGGKSEMGLVMIATDGAAAGLRIPLVAKATGTTAGTSAYVNNTIINKFDFSGYNMHNVTSQKLGEVIESARITKNNGRGDFEVVLTFDKLEKSETRDDQSRLNLVFTRNEEAIDMNLLK